MVKIIGLWWCIVMGDDFVEGWVDNVVEKYYVFGYECKEYLVCVWIYVSGSGE